MHRYLRHCLLMLIGCLTATAALADDNAEFERKMYSRVSSLLHNHTYDRANLAIADSIYAESQKRESLQGKLYANRLRMYALVAIPDSAPLMAATDEAIELAGKLQDMAAYTEAMNVKISFFTGQEHYFKATQLTQEMLEKSKGNPEMLIQSYSLMANIYQNRDMQDMAIQYFCKALEHVEEEDSINLCIIYRSLAECNTVLEKHDVALEWAQKALDMADKNSVYYYWSAFTYLYTLFGKKDYNTFLAEYNRIKLLDQPIDGLLPAYIQHQLHLRYECLRGNFDEAMRLAESIEYKSLRLPAIILVYRMSGNWRKTVEYLDLYNAYEDSVRSQMAMEEMTEIETQMGVDRLKAEQQKLKEHNQRLLLYSILIVALISTLALAYIGIRRRIHIKELNAKNEELNKKNEELNQKNEELMQARDEAERSSQMKTHFMQNMSHEIRTPLHAISGFAQLLSGETDAEEREQYSQIIVNSVNSMTSMLEDTLLLSDLDAGTYKLQLSDLPATEIQQSTQRWAEGLLPESMTFESHTDLAADVLLHVDAHLLQNVLQKLIGNAMKFNPSGCSIMLISHSGSDGRMQYIVSDTGCGIPTEWNGRIFERFAKVDEYIPGVGIGLTICREAIEQMGGTIHLDTQYTEGARFIIDLPCTNA